MKLNIKRKNNLVLILFTLLFVFAIPYVSNADTIYDTFDIVQGVITASNPTNIVANVNLSQNSGPETLAINFYGDNTLSLTGTVNGTFYNNVSGTYSVLVPSVGNPIAITAELVFSNSVTGILEFSYATSDLKIGTVEYHSGDIIGGSGTFTNVPIPAAGWLLGSGFLGLIGIRKKYKI